ncbi:MAG: peptidase domain-containing ABC transporter [Bacteroidales bacterium]|nr:peptidase domain-containing ABC transporter [Bacteroidales bacterium]
MIKFDTYIQHDSMMCGVTCLQMICKHYGMVLSQVTLNEMCPSSAEGVSLLGLYETAIMLGFEAEAAQGNVDELTEVEMPCILHWNQNHFVVLYGFEEGRYYVADPGCGKRVLTRKELCESWTQDKTEETDGVVLMLKKTDRTGKMVLEEKDEKSALGLLSEYFKKYKKELLWIGICLVIAGTVQLVLPFLTQSIVDVGIEKKDVSVIMVILAGQLVLTLSETIAELVRRRVLLKVSLNINLSLLTDFFRKLMKLPMDYFDTKLTGDLMQRIEDHGRIEDFLTQQTIGALFSIFTLVMFAVVLCFYSWVVFCVFLIASAMYVMWLSVFLKKRRILDYDYFEKRAVNDNLTYQMVTSMQEIKLQGCQQRRRDEWVDAQKKLYDVKVGMQKMQQSQVMGGAFVNEAKNIIITIIAAHSVIVGDITLGTMLAIQYIIGQMNSPIAELMSFFYDLQDAKLSLERINEVHSRREEKEENGVGKKIGVAGNIKIENVGFSYSKFATKKTLDNICLEIEMGKTTAIVGASGSGKTTLIKLLLGYYRANEGTIKIGGEEIGMIDIEWWRKQCGVVMQEGIVFSESIARNIAVGDGEIDMERVRVAAATACIDDYVENLPNGYDTKVGCDGIGLSHGQKQRLLIARAVYKDPQYIVLDEATNALDANIERRVVENLDEYCAGRTVVVIAHRLSTVMNADKIVVVDKGKIIEVGTHVELTKHRGMYYELIKNQLDLGN